MGFMPILKDLPPLFIKGYLIPLTELLSSLYLSHYYTMLSDTESRDNLHLFLGLFLVINIIESLVIGFEDSDYTLGYYIGAIMGILLFAGVVEIHYPSAIWATFVILGTVVIGIGIKIFKQIHPFDFFRTRQE